MFPGDFLMLMKKLVPFALAMLLGSVAFAEEVSTAGNADNFNIRFGPISLLVGVVNAGLDFVVHENFTVGPEFAYLHRSLSSSGSFSSDYDVKAYAVGARAIWYANGVFTDGLYITPKLHYASAKLSTTDSVGTVEGEASTMMASGLIGYGWFWESFNIHLGGGFAIPFGEYKVKIKDSTGTEESVNVSSTGNLALEFDLGWTF